MSKSRGRAGGTHAHGTARTSPPPCRRGIASTEPTRRGLAASRANSRRRTSVQDQGGRSRPPSGHAVRDQDCRGGARGPRGLAEAEYRRLPVQCSGGRRAGDDRSAALTRAHGRVLTRGLCAGVYTEELFETDNDEDNRAAVRAVSTDQLKLVGLAVYGPRGSVDRALDGLQLHP